MLEVTSDYIKAIENHLRVFEANFDLNGKRYTKTKIASATYDSSIGNSNDFTIGGGYINSLEIEIKEIIEGLQEMMPATMSVAIAGKTVPLGKFFVTEVKLNRNDKKTKIKLQDEFVRLSGAYDSQLTYPAYTRDILSEIVRLTGITTDTNIQLVNDQVAKKLEKTSYREALVYLAQLSGSFVRFNRNGKLDFIKLKTTSRHITKDMYKPGGLERDEIPYRLKGIECKSADKVVYKSGLSTGNIMKLKNPWVTQEILDRVFNEYRDFNFYPYTLSWRGDMAMESGDWVTVHWDENIYFDIPMLSYKLSFDGGLSAHSSGNAAGVAQGTYKYKGTMQRQIEYLDELITKQGSMYLDTSSPTKPKNGDIWFKPNGGYVEMWERVEGSWVKKADSANVGEIVNTITTDELLAKKVSAAIGNYITLNAKNITAGDLDLARLRIMNGLQEIVSVRDGKVVMNIDKLTINSKDVATKEDLKKIELTPGPKGDRGEKGALDEKQLKEIRTSVDSKADQSLTQEQLNALAEKIQLHDIELKAKATMDQFSELEKAYNAFVKSNVESQKKSESDLIEAGRRIEFLSIEFGGLKEMKKFIDTYMSASNEGLIIGKNDASSSIKVSHDRISMFSAGKEVMYISQGVIHIDNGIFTASVQIGRFRTEQYYLDKDVNIVRYVGG
jgi:hypothetical protein